VGVLHVRRTPSDRLAYPGPRTDRIWQGDLYGIGLNRANQAWSHDANSPSRPATSLKLKTAQFRYKTLPKTGNRECSKHGRKDRISIREMVGATNLRN